MMSVCVAKPPPVVAEPILAPCDRCKRCLSWVSSWQTAQATAMGNNDSLSLATVFLNQCTTNFTKTSAAPDGDAVRCRNIAGAIAFSFNGNLAKRAGALCYHLGDCAGEATAASCNVTSGARLDLCSVDGSVGGAAVPGIPDGGKELPPHVKCLQQFAVVDVTC